MFTVLLGQWRFSQAHIIGWHSLTFAYLIRVYGGRRLCSLYYTEALHQQLAHLSFVQEENRLAVMRKHTELVLGLC